VYGLAARWDSQAGVRRIFLAKGRSPEQPVAVLFSSVDAVKEALPDLEAPAAKVLEALLPGPFTFVVATSVLRPALVGTADSLGVRVPDEAALLGLLRSLGTPLAATSANLSGGEDAGTLADVDPTVLAYCSIAFAAPGVAPSPGLASTVVDLRPLSTGDTPMVLREGTASAREVLQRIETLQ
jgi:L-threonylcarbamoyladenylate synthase